jgi:hypothetical protein
MMMIMMLVMTFGTTLYHHHLGPILIAPQGKAPRCLVGLKLTPAPCAGSRVLPMEKVSVDSAGRRYWWDLTDHLWSFHKTLEVTYMTIMKWGHPTVEW